MNACTEPQNNPRLFPLGSSPLHWLQTTSHLPKIPVQLREQRSYINTLKRPGESFMKYLWRDDVVGLSYFVLGESRFPINASVEIFAKFCKHDKMEMFFNKVVYLLWHMDLLLGKDRVISSYTTAVAR
jgi:hypothetical protein